MIELEFEGALQSMSGIAEALDAAGIDDHVPTHGGPAGRDEVSDFRPTDIVRAAQSAAAVAASAIAAPVPRAPVPAEAGRIELDLRALVAPEPMVRALAAADALEPGATLVVWTPLLPTPLMQLLAERGLDAHAQSLPDGTAQVTIRHRRVDRHNGSADGQARA